MAVKFHIGTSGWFYNHWLDRFYPVNIPKSKWFEHYCENFTTVELNSPFYRMPKETTVKGWIRNAPDDFLYSIKANRTITHLKRLKNAKDIALSFIDTLSLLGSKLGVVLFQLPPSMKKDIVLLSDFLFILPDGIRWTVEFRNKSWFSDDVYEILKNKNASFCSVSYPDLPEIIIKTTDFIYLRMHGIEERYASYYSTDEIKMWLSKIIESNPKEAFIYFNNDYNGYAVRNALEMIELISN